MRRALLPLAALLAAAPAERPPARPTASAPPRLVARVERATVTVTLQGGVLASLGSSLGGHLARATAVETALADARAGRIDAVELGLRLHDRLAGRPELGHGLVGELVAEPAPEVALQLARALAELEDDATLRAETVATLRDAPPEARAVGLLALLGRGEPEVLALAAASFIDDAPAARATAGFLLNNAPGDAGAEALAAARAILADPAAETRLREEAVTLLGRADAAEADVALLEKLALAGELPVRARALAALEATGLPRDQVRAVFARVAREPDAPEPLALMAGAYLSAPR